MNATRYRALGRSWELIAVGIILVAYAAANVAIVMRRPAMMRSAVASVDSLLLRDRSALDRDLARWHEDLLGDGQWIAGVVGVVLAAHPGWHASFDAADVARLRALTAPRFPGARVWILDSTGRTLVGLTRDSIDGLQRDIARNAIARDTPAMGAVALVGRDLRIAVASPVRGAGGHGLVAVLDLSAGARLRNAIPKLTWEDHTGNVAVTFPFETMFVGATWTGAVNDPQVGWPASGWSLTDSSLIVRRGSLSDSSARFELGIPRAAARATVETRSAWLHVAAALLALVSCVAVLLSARASRNERLRTTERSLADSELRVARAESAAAKAELSVIQARLNPHFLANALHSAAALVATDPGAAEDTLDQLGDLFRHAMEQSERHAVRLAEEWHFVRDYLAIEQMRFGDRLRVEMDLDPAVAECEVPSFTLQPLVENAIRHGIAPRVGGGTLRVTARRRANRLELSVSDDGRGAELDDLDSSPGSGLRTLKQRLALDEALDGRVEVITSRESGFEVRIDMMARSVV